MVTRSLLLLAVLSLPAARALADQHPLECFGSGTIASKEGEDTESSNKRATLHCAGLIGQIIGAAVGDASVAEYESSGPWYPTLEVQADHTGNVEAFLGISYLQKGERVQPFVRFGVGAVRMSFQDEKAGDPAAIMGGGMDILLGSCPPPPTRCASKWAVRFRVEAIGVKSDPVRAFPRATLAIGRRFGIGAHTH